MRKALVVGVAVVGMLAGTPGPAAGDAPGAGVFVGHEYAPLDQALIMPSLLCAEFNASGDDPLTIELDLTGTFHGLGVGNGTATFTGTTPYKANPEGTYAMGTDCLTPASVPGTMTLSFSDGTTTYSCTDDASAEYMRRGTTAITLDYSGSCNGMATDVLFTGGQEPCPPIGGCPTDPNASSLLEGDYVQIPVS